MLCILVERRCKAEALLHRSPDMHRSLGSVVCLTTVLVSLAQGSTARAAVTPQGAAEPSEPPSAPLTVAADPPPVPNARAEGAIAVDPPEVKPPAESQVIGAWSVGALAPILSVARSAPFSFTWFGVSLLAFSGRGWVLPAPKESGQILRFGGRLSLLEAMPVAGWPMDIGVEYGWRFASGTSDHMYIAAGAHGSVAAVAYKHEFNVLHLPEISLGYQRHGNASFAEVGVLGGLSVAGRYAVGANIPTNRSEDGDGSYFAATHYLKPYAGAHASILIEPVLISLVARRTFLFEGAPGRALDQGQGMICWQFFPDKRDSSFGGCVTADVFDGDLVREAPAPGPGGEMVSLRIGLTLMQSRVVGP
jgi:hypothetical protein